MKKAKKVVTLSAALGMTATLVLAGCASEDQTAAGGAVEGSCLAEAPADGKPKAGTVVRDSLEGTTLTFAAYGGEYQEAQEKAFLDPFAACSGATIQQAQSDTAKLEAMVKAGNVQWNVAYAGMAVLHNRCDELATPIDTSKVDLSESTNGLLSECQVPGAREPAYLVYNTDEFDDDPPTGMKDFFDLEKYPGKRLINGSPGYPDWGTWSGMAQGLGWTLESGDPFPFEEVSSKLEGIKEHLVYFQSGADLVQKLEQADVAMGWAWAGRAYNASVNGAPYLPVYNDMVYTTLDFYIPKGAPDLDASFALLNYMMGAEQQAHVTEQFVYSPENKHADPEVSEDMEAFVLSDKQLGEAMNASDDFFMDPEKTERMLEDRQRILLGG